MDAVMYEIRISANGSAVCFGREMIFDFFYLWRLKMLKINRSVISFD